MEKEYRNAYERESFLKDNCDKVEEKGYMKPFTPKEIQGHKESLANISIEISEISEEKKAQSLHYKHYCNLVEQHSKLVSNIKSKSEYVKEICYKLLTKSNGKQVSQCRWRFD